MDVLLGGGAGLVTGVLGSFVAALVQLAGKMLRDRRHARRGLPPGRDRVFTPYWPLFGLLGAIAGSSWTWRLDGTWVTGAIAGLGAPAVAALVFATWALAQLRR